MNNLEDCFKTGMAMFWVLLLAVTSESYRPAIESELEKELGRKPTNEEWHYFLQESYQRSKAELQQETLRQWCQRLVDRKTIHDFVWNS